MPPTKTTARRLAEAYLTHVVYARRCSPKTVRLYSFYLHRFLGYLAAHRLGRLPTRTDRISDFLRWLTQERLDKTRKIGVEGGRQLSGAALRKAYTTVGTFYRWAADLGRLEQNPFRLMRPPLLGKPRISFASRRACRTLLDVIAACINPRAAHGLELASRDQALFGALFWGGLRASEACQLRLVDVDLEAGFLIVHGKGDVWRDVPIRPELRTLLLRWLRVRRRLCAAVALESPFLFVGLPGRGRRKYASPAPLDIHRIARVLRDVYLPAVRRRCLSFPERFTPHSLRHSIATSYRRRGMDSRELQELLGHKSLETTKIYDHVLPEQLRTAVLRA